MGIQHSILSFTSGRCLVEFHAQQNNIEELPEKFSTLKKLKTLDMSENRLCSLPPNFNDMKSLEVLKLGNNQLTAVHGKTTHTPTLVVYGPDQLTLIYCGLKMGVNLRCNTSVSCAAGIESLKKVEHLDISGNHLSVIPEDIQKMVSLRTFKASKNEIEVIPPMLGTFMP